MKYEVRTWKGYNPAINPHQTPEDWEASTTIILGHVIYRCGGWWFISRCQAGNSRRGWSRPDDTVKRFKGAVFLREIKDDRSGTDEMIGGEM